MRALSLLFSLILLVLSSFLIYKSGDKCSSIKVQPVRKIIKIGFIPLKDKETVVASDVLRGLGLANGIRFEVSTYKNKVFLTASPNDIKNPEGIIVFLKELAKLPYKVDIDYFSAGDKGILLKLELYKRGIK